MENVNNNDENLNNQNVKSSNNFTLPVDRAYVWLVVGKPNSGKTHFLKSIFYDYATIKHFKFGIIYTQNKMNCDLDFCPEKSIKEYSDEDCEKYINKDGEIRDLTLKRILKDYPFENKKVDNVKKRVILIDEVDVFFGSDFFNMCYSPVAQI